VSGPTSPVPDRSSPFTLHAVPPGGLPADPDASSARVEPVEPEDRPWGRLRLVAVLEGRFVSRVLELQAGGCLALAKYLTNDTSLYLQSGRVTVAYGADLAGLRTVVLEPGERIAVPANLMHRVTAEVPSVVLQTSTAWPGWRTDLVVLEQSPSR
jgi:mannose-6-phosphate isomerase-like protein (cupin superfamily)